MFDEKNNSAENTGTENREIPVSKDQTSMFDNMETKPGYIHIAHEEGSIGPVEGPMPADSKYSFEKSEEKEEKPEGVNKAKVLAALAIVGVAAYVANWVQEPVQLKADVLSDDVVAEESLMAQADETTETADMPTTSVDVSLFGFEPAVLNVEKDTKVVWTNTSSEQQTLIGSSVNGESFTSPVLESGESFEYAFTSDDDFEYYSTYNPALKASIRVGDGAAVMETTTTTDDTTTQPEDLFGSAPENNTATGTENAFENLNEILAQQQVLQNQVLETAVNSTNTSTTESTDNASTTATAEETAEELRQAAAEADELAQTGPEDMLYVAALGMIVYFNRKKLGAIFA